MWREHVIPFALLALVLAVSIVVRIRLLDAPLERDEGEHGYLAQMLLAGQAPWQTDYNLKLPGTDFLYAGVMAMLGQTPVAIRIGLLVANLISVLLVGLLGRRLFGITGGAVSAAAFALLSCSQSVLGTIAHSTHFVVLFALAGLLVLLRARDRIAWLFCSGLAFGLAFLMKQPGIAFAGFGGVYVLWRWRADGVSAGRGIQRLAAFGLGVALPYAFLCLALWRAGTFPRFWFWTVTLARAYAAKVSLSDAVQLFSMGIASAVDVSVFLWALAALGIVVACRNLETRRAALFVLALNVFSFAAVSAGGVFRSHYFVLMLPAVALACGAWVSAGAGVGQMLRRSAPGAGAVALFCFAGASLYAVAMQREYLFRMNTYEFARSSWGLNPFPEALQVADYLRVHTEPGAKIAVLGSEAEIYFYAHRRAATGYLFTYGLMENHEYALPGQLEMISEIEEARPEYLVFSRVSTSWLATVSSPKDIFQWIETYTKRDYEVAGVIDILPGEPALYVWGEFAPNYHPKSGAYLVIYRRRSAAADGKI